MGWRTQLRRGIQRVLGWMIIASMALLTTDVLWGVFSRYVLGEQTRWTDELATILMVWVSLLGAALVYAEKGHLGVDYLVGKMDPGARRLAEVVSELLVLAFALGIMVGGGWILVSKTLAAGQDLPALGWMKGYVYLVVPISGLLTSYFAIDRLAGGGVDPRSDLASPEEG